MTFQLPYRVDAARTELAVPGFLNRPIDRDVKKMIIRDEFLSAELANAITDGSITENVEGAAAVVLTVHDPDRKALERGLLKQWVKMNPPVYGVVNRSRRKINVPSEWDEIYASLDGRDLALAGVAKNGPDFNLTFENRAVNELRKYKKHKVWQRGTFTRAMVIRDMCKEVRGYHIAFYSPELHKVQPIDTSQNQLTASAVQSTMQKGFASGAQVKVKGVLASSQQMSIISRVLRTGESMSASYKVLQSSIMTITQESDVSLLNGSGGYGPFSQLRNGAWPASVTDVEADAKAFFAKAIQLDAQNPSQTPGEIAQGVQASAHPTEYNRWEGEAKNTLSLWGASAGSGTAATYQEYNTYAFQRGENGSTEDSWTCGGRLAQEVDWRLFMLDNTMYYVEDNQLMRQRPIDTISEKTDGIDEVNYDIDIGKKVAQCTVMAHVERWLAPPGTVIELNNSGPANGHWLVHQIKYPLYRRNAEITLQLPTPPKPEPAPTTKSVSVPGSKSGGASSASALLSGVSSSVPGHPELKPGISQVVNLVLSKFPKLIITSTISGTHASYSDHYSGHAADLSCGDQKYMDSAGAWVQANLGTALRQGIHNPTLSINAGKVVSASFWGSSTWAQHINHLHLATYT